MAIVAGSSSYYARIVFYTYARLDFYFLAWAKCVGCVEIYESKVLDGARRKFPAHILVGPEQFLARLHHEHDKPYMPLGLGEIMSRHTYAALGLAT